MRSSFPLLRQPAWLVVRFVTLIALFGLVASRSPASTFASSPATLVKDINTAVPSAMGNLLDQVVNVGTTTFFTASTQPNSGNGHNGLYKTDGSAGGTLLVADLRPSALTAYGQRLTFANQTAIGSSDSTSLALWMSDGTSAGTTPFYQFDASVKSIFSMLGTLSGLFVLTNDITGGYSLWRSDGTSAGTSRVYQFAPTIGNFPSTLVAVGTTLFFRGYDTDAGWELWRSDGTTAGTVRVKDIKPGIDSAYPESLTVVGANLFFLAPSATGTSVWKSDGTEAGTVEIKKVTSSSMPDATPLVNVNGTAFFATQETDGIGNGTRQLWKSDGTPAGTTSVKTLPNATSSIPNPIGPFTAVGNRLFFMFDSQQAGAELWTSDGTEAGTTLVKDINPGTNRLSLYSSVAVGSTLFFTIDDSIHGNELWQSDGSTTGTTLVKDLVPGTDSSAPRKLYNANGTLLFVTAYFPKALTLWRSDGSDIGTQALKSFTPQTDDAFSLYSPRFVTLGTTLFFIADDGTHGADLWRSDGTAAGTQFVKDTANYFGPQNLMAVGNRLFFTADDGVHGYELWTSDGTEASTTMVKDINGYADGSANNLASSVANMVNFNGTLYFSADDGVHGRELWKSDGTEAGTVRITDLNPGSRDGVYGLAVAGNKLLITADDGVHGIELWVSDGTATDTTLLKDIAPGADSSQFSGALKLVQLGDQFFFAVPTGPTTGLWKTDTTATGTVFVKAESPNLDNAAISSNRLFYLSGDAATGSELWVSDGTIAGTQMVKDINPGSASSFPSQLTNLNGVLLFVADDGTTMAGLWRSDGTAAGTQRIATSATNQPLSNIKNLTALLNEGVAVFGTATICTGIELWQTDGTAQNTRLTTDIAPGPASANPHSFVVNGDSLYFAADDWTYGMELWRMPVSVLSKPSTTYNVYLPVLAGK